MVLLDVMMPDMTGWEVLKSIRNNPVFKKSSCNNGDSSQRR